MGLRVGQECVRLRDACFRQPAQNSPSSIERTNLLLFSLHSAPEFETEVIAKKTNSPIAKQVVKKKRKGKKASNKNKSKPEDEQDYSEASQSDSHHPMFDDNILRVDTNACFVSSQSSSESEFSDPETGFRSRLRYDSLPFKAF